VVNASEVMGSRFVVPPRVLVSLNAFQDVGHFDPLARVGVLDHVASAQVVSRDLLGLDADCLDRRLVQFLAAAEAKYDSGFELRWRYRRRSKG